MSQAYFCSVCFDVFDRGDLAHCRKCHSHYPADMEECKCHHYKFKGSTMKPLGMTVAESIKMIAAIHDRDANL